MRQIEELLALTARLRDPDCGCPWDRAQTFETIAPHTIEEAYEVVDAIVRGQKSDLKEELGDLLFQIVLLAQLAEEDDEFTFVDIVAGIVQKMTRRHPHVFGSLRYANVVEQSEGWERIKAAERTIPAESVLDGVPVALPALTRAVKLQRKAADIGFDWPNAQSVLQKIEEELMEVRLELKEGTDTRRIAEEVGDLMFACANLARHLDLDPETTVRNTNAKFESRFRRVEAWLAESVRSPEQASLAEMDALWERAKFEERDGNRVLGEETNDES